MRTRVRGYTLYELLITTLLVALILAIALPSFSATLARQRQRAELNALFHAVHLARKESIVRRRVVSICPSTDGERCAPTPAWSAGWIMIQNDDRDWPPRRDAGEPLLLRHQVGPGIRIAANRPGFTLRSTYLRATNGTIIVCDDARRVAARALVVSYTGRPRVAVHNRSGEPYDCPD